MIAPPWRVPDVAIVIAALALAALALVATPFVAHSATTCAAPVDFVPRESLRSDGIVVVYRTLPAHIELGRHFAIDAIVCADGATPTLTRVDAEMPAHRHGMNYRPTLAAKGAGRYLVEGFMFHMPGRWELSFDVEAGGRRTRLVTPIAVE